MKDNIYVIEGKKITEMTISLLKFIDPFKELDKNTRFGLKPNLVCAKDPKYGATTHTEIVEGVIKYLKDNGFSNIVILEGSWVGDTTKRAFKVCKYDVLSRKYNVPLIDVQKDTYHTREYKGLEMNVSDALLNIDYLINLPLIKGHCQTNVTCALKNLKGLISNDEKRRFHRLGLHKPIAYLNKVITQNLIIADAICPDPYFEEGGQPKQMNRLVASLDPVLIDSFAARLLGYGIEDVPYIKIAMEERVGCELKNDDKIIYINDGAKKIENIEKLDKKYLNIIENQHACSACYSNLVMALEKLNNEGLIPYITEDICIGQYFRGYKGDIGVGECTSEFYKTLEGCPPSVEDIIEFIRSEIINKDEV